MLDAGIWEVVVNVGPQLENDVVSVLELFESMGVSVEDDGSEPVFQEGIKFQRCRVRGYFQDHETIQGVEQRLRELLASGESWEQEPPVWRLLADQDWQESWKENFHPIAVAEKLLILPSWLDPPPEMAGRLVLRMDPEMAFGSGQHETTQGCLAALEGCTVTGQLGRVLDLGTGSGILAIAALLLGATHVVATDMDPVAVETTWRNFESNPGPSPDWRQRVAIVQTDQVPAGHFNTIVANILAPVLCHMAPAIARGLAAGGRAILAGLLTGQAEEVMACCQQAGLVCQQRWDLGDWTILQLEKDVSL